MKNVNMLRRMLFVFMIACTFAITVFAQSQYAGKCPLTFGQWELIPEFSDEFDVGKLDETKWFPNNPGWKGREPAFFSKANVEVKDGMLHLTAKAENLPNLPKGYHTFTTAAVQSKNRVKYGYFEIRCRPMNSAASSAFWFYAIDKTLWTEIDVFEIGGKAPDKEHSYFTTLHVFKTPETGDYHWSDGAIWTSPYRLADAFHNYGFLWTKDDLIWYVDGKEIRRRKNTDWHQPLTMNFDSETMPQWYGLPDPNDLPSIFSIDYIRAWQRLDEDNVTDNRIVLFDAEKNARVTGQDATTELKNGELTVTTGLVH